MTETVIAGAFIVVAIVLFIALVRSKKEYLSYFGRFDLGFFNKLRFSQSRV